MKLLAIFLAGMGIALTCIVQIANIHHPTVSIGMLVLLVAILLRWNSLMAILRKDKLKPYWVTIPYLIILASAIIANFIHQNGDSTLFMFLAIEFGLLYLLGKDLGKAIFWSLPPLAVLTSLILTFSLGKYDICNLDHIAAIAMVLGVLFTPAKHKWITLTLVLPGLLFSNSEEGLLAIGVIALLMLIRGDINLKSLLPAGVMIASAIVVFGTPLGDDLFPRITTGRFLSTNPDILLHDRWYYYEEGVRNFTIAGTGWNYNTLCLSDPMSMCCVIHNVPLLIATQIGVPAGLAWLSMVVFAFLKTRLKYAFIALFAISMIDHMFWTFLMALPWLLVGVASKETEPDYIFKGVTDENLVVQPALASADSMDGG
jgi:hypothetical protein